MMREGKLSPVVFWWHVLDAPPLEGKPVNRKLAEQVLIANPVQVLDPALVFGYTRVMVNGEEYWVPEHLIEYNEQDEFQGVQPESGRDR